MRYGATLLVFIVVQMVINRLFYGDVLLSGYGPASYMFEFSRSRLAANLANFRQSLPYSHTQVIWILWPGALLILRRQKWAWQLSAVAAAAGLPYLFYIVFQGWESLRFLLPTIALVFILAGGAVGEVLGDSNRGRPFMQARRLPFSDCAGVRSCDESISAAGGRTASARRKPNPLAGSGSRHTPGKARRVRRSAQRQSPLLRPSPDHPMGSDSLGQDVGYASHPRSGWIRPLSRVGRGQ